MKSIFTTVKKLGILILYIMAGSVNAQCPTVFTASITTNNYNGEITIEPQFDVTPLSGKIIYQIGGGAGSYSLTSLSMTNPVTFYGVTAGSYTLCATADSLAGGCPLIMDCQLFTGNAGFCNASFTYSTDSNCVTHFVNTSTGASLQYQWNINGNFYTTTDVNVSLPDGSYNVELINQALVGPSTFVSCDTANQMVNVACIPYPCHVNASFYMNADSANIGNYYLYNTSIGNGTLTYIWDFGDATSFSTQPYPIHQYAVPGQYIICFTVTATNSLSTCSDAYCDSSSTQKMAAGFLMNKITVVPSIVTSVKESILPEDFKTYPNPIKDHLVIEMKLAKETLSYHIADSFGKIILKNAISESKTLINTTSLTQGFYILYITDMNGNTLKSLKLIK
jgi:PKD repeat protein